MMYKIVRSKSVHSFGTCKKNAAVQCRLLIKKHVRRKICLKSALHRSILLQGPKVVCRPRSDSNLHFDSQNIYQIRRK